MRFFWGILSLFLVLPTVSAQSFDWDLRFDSRFDNRELDRLKYLRSVPSLTFFSARLVPLVGVSWGDYRVMAGVSYTLDMGDEVAAKGFEPVVFYSHTTSRYGVLVGKFERRMLIGDYSRAIYSPAHVFYDNVLDGFALQLTPPRARFELVLDWDGKSTATRREGFRVLSAGEYRPGAWLFGYSLDVYHLATRRNVKADGVVDHILFDVHAGVALEKSLRWFERFEVRAGWINAFDRDRDALTGWLRPGGVSFEVTVQKWGVGLRNMFYSGEVLMPLWHSYGVRINRGLPIMASAPTNNCTALYWLPRLSSRVSLRFEAGVMTDGKKVGFTQGAHVGVTF